MGKERMQGCNICSEYSILAQLSKTPRIKEVEKILLYYKKNKDFTKLQTKIQIIDVRIW